MKKLALTLVAVVFGTCVGFAQSIPQSDLISTVNTESGFTIERMANRQDEAGRRTIDLYSLPETVLEQFKYSKHSGHAVISVTEVEAIEDEQAGAVRYELVLQESANPTAAAPLLVVLLDEHGEILSENETSLMAQEKK